MGDTRDKDANTFVIYLGNDAIVADAVAPEIAKPGSLHGSAELTRVVHASQSELQEIPKAPLDLSVQSANGFLDALGILNPPGHATFLPRL